MFKCNIAKLEKGGKAQWDKAGEERSKKQRHNRNNSQVNLNQLVLPLHSALIWQRDTYFADGQLLSPGNSTGGASSVIKWNPTPKVTNEMTTPIKKQMCYNSTLQTEHKFLYLYSLLISSWGLNTDLNLKSNCLTWIRETQICIWAVGKVSQPFN